MIARAAVPGAALARAGSAAVQTLPDRCRACIGAGEPGAGIVACREALRAPAPVAPTTHVL